MLACTRWNWQAVVIATGIFGSGTGVVGQTVEFTDTTLENGLRVIIAEDHVAPVISIAVNYDVGSRNERRGLTGFALDFGADD